MSEHQDVLELLREKGEFVKYGPILEELLSKTANELKESGKFNSVEEFYDNLATDKDLQDSVLVYMDELMKEYTVQDDNSSTEGFPDGSSMELGEYEQKAVTLLDQIKVGILSGELNMKELFDEVDTDVKYTIGLKYNVLTIEEYGLLGALLRYRSAKKTL